MQIFRDLCSFLFIFGLSSAALAQPYLQNISTRAVVGAGDRQVIAGFVVTGGEGSQALLFKAAGQSLQAQGLDTQLNPSLTLHDSIGALHANDDWQTDARQVEIPSARQPQHAQDSAILYELSQNPYTVILSAADASENQIGLVSIDALGEPGSLRVRNLSTRAIIGEGDNQAIPGFIIADDGQPGALMLKVLIKAAGQSLQAYGVNTALDPRITVIDMLNNVVLGENDNWIDTPRLAEIPVYMRPTHEQDAALVLSLPPGVYTVLTSPMSGVDNIGLVSIDVLD